MAVGRRRHELSVAEFCLAVQKVLRASERFAGEAGLNLLEYDLLLTLSAYPRGTCSSISVLSEQLLSQHHVAAGAVGKLAEKELIVTQRSLRDRRSLILTLTAKGKSLLNEIAFRCLGELCAHGPRLIGSLTTLID